METNIFLSNTIHKDIRQECELRISETLESMQMISKVLCHISDGLPEFYGILVLYLADGEKLITRTTSKDPLDVVNELIFMSTQRINKYIKTANSFYAKNDKIMIVDDDSESIAIMQKILKNLNQPTVHVRNPYEALQMIVKNQYKLVIMDICMPELSGLQVITQADQVLDWNSNNIKNKNRRYFTTFSAEPDLDISNLSLHQFDYIGHWKKDMSYSNLSQMVSKTLSLL